MTWRLALLLAAVMGGVALLIWGWPRPAPGLGDRPLAALPEGPLKVVAFGTSLTAKNDWPAALAPRLETCRGAPVEILEIARPGAGSDWGETQLEEVIAAAPDLVLMEFAINDADIRDGQSPAAARATHDRILEALRTALPEARILLLTMNHASGLRGLARPWLATHYAQYRDLAEAHGTGLLDLYPRWRAAPPEIRTLADGLHPSDAQVRAVLMDPLEAAICAA